MKKKSSISSKKLIKVAAAVRLLTDLGYSVSKRIKLKDVEHITIPEAGHDKYFIANVKLGIYTCIGADNLHHASNKATKIFGSNWDRVRLYNNTRELMGYTFCDVKEFNRAINV